MKLPYPKLGLDAAIAEFDFWVTPALSELRDTPRYQREMRRVRAVLDLFKDLALQFTPQQVRQVPLGEIIADRYLAVVMQKITTADPAEAQQTALADLDALAATLFLVTGKSDNNAKCQFPLFLRAQLGWKTLPSPRRKRGVVTFQQQRIPRVLKSVDYMSRVASLLALGSDSSRQDRERTARVHLCEFVGFVLSDENSRDQFWSVLRCYIELANIGGRPEALLAPLVAFQVRGSVSASGGHEPEELLRARMTEWGLERDVDFNIADVVLDVEAGRLHEDDAAADEENEEENEAAAAAERKKTRAYDFVLPFRTAGWSPRIFVQSQFYAGDSGSVSHKNVDQTSTSRGNATVLVARAWPDSPLPRFIEYVDGAGYVASLNRDLKTLLSMNDTEGFTQVRTSPVRLRSQLQQIGFLTPLELEHALLRAGDREAAVEVLKTEGYSPAEIDRCIDKSLALGISVLDGNGELAVSADRRDLARRYLLLDVIACGSNELVGGDELKGVVFVPGFGAYFGMTLDQLGETVNRDYAHIWTTAASVTTDLAWLCERGFVVQR